MAAVAYVLVVGFHHQLGPQVDFAYPPLPLHDDSEKSAIPNASPYVLPEEWKFLPFLALPDGIHNVDKDFVYFLLPPTEGSATKASFYGVSCYQQINAEDLIEKSADVTRNRVQKAIVVIATKPLFGVIKAKVEMVTEAYFHQRDFTKFELLESLYNGLNHSLSPMVDYETLHIGTSPRYLMKKFGKKALVLFKLLLLERRVIFYGNPASELSTILLSLISLFPGLIATLDDAADPNLGEEKDIIHTYSIVGSEHSQTATKPPTQHPPHAPHTKYTQSTKQLARGEMWATLGLPLRLFEKHSVFLPYFSLLQLNHLSQAHIKSYVIGCSNIVILQQKKIKPEIFVDVSKGTIEYMDHSEFFAQLLYLSAADYEFITKITEMVDATWEDGELLGGNDELSSWEGSNGWIRQQFELYLAALVCTVSTQEVEGLGKSSVDDFFGPWVTVWQRTQNYCLWNGTVNREKISSEFTPGHPFHVSGNFVELRSGIARRVEELNTLTSPLQTEITKVVSEGGKVLTGYIENLSGSIKASGVTTTLGTTVNSWWKMGTQYVNAAVEKARETLEEPATTSKAHPPSAPQPEVGGEEEPKASSQILDEHFVFV